MKTFPAPVFPPVTGVVHVPGPLANGLPAVVLWINCETAPFLDEIGARNKLYETRNSRNVLRSLIGQRVILAETGHDRHLARYTAVIAYAFPVFTQELWDTMRPVHRVPAGDKKYDWKPETRAKWLYRLTDVNPLPVSFTVTSYQNIGRSWAIMKEV